MRCVAARRRGLPPGERLDLPVQRGEMFAERMGVGARYLLLVAANPGWCRRCCATPWDRVVGDRVVAFPDDLLLGRGLAGRWSGRAPRQGRRWLDAAARQGQPPERNKHRSRRSRVFATPG
jgi:hypothetical protein